MQVVKGASNTGGIRMRRLLLVTLALAGCHRDLSVDPCWEHPELCNADAPNEAQASDAETSDADAQTIDTSVATDASSDDVSDVAGDTVPTETSGDAPVCNIGDYRCTGDTLEQCATDRSSWTSVVACPAGACDATAKRCSACVPGTYSCTGADRYECSSLGVKVKSATCATAELCAASTGATCATPACGVSEKTCSGKTARTCNAGRTGWTDTACSISCSAGSCLRIADMPIDMGAHVCVALSDGSVRCWGDNLHGQVGGASTADDVPGLVAGISSAAQVAVSAYSSGVRLADGSLRWWGELYTATTPGSVDSAVPLAIPGLASGTSIMLGRLRICAVQMDKTLKCYGKGPLGDGTWNDFTTPKAVPGLTNVLDGGTILELERAGFAIVDGGVKGWGTNYFGQLGTGSTGEQLAPVSAFSFATQISFLNSHTCARLASGGVRCVGSNDTGQLGKGSISTGGPVLVPIDVPGITGARNVCTGQYFSCAALADKTVRCWGLNDRGQLGDGTTTDHYSQAPVMGITTAVKVGCGYEFACALLEDGTMKCWGDNQAGQLGIGKSVATYRATAVAPAW